MTTATTLRRHAGQRISAAVWGLLVMGSGVLTIAALSGYDIDLQLGTIIVLSAVGGWLLLSAAVSGLGRRKEIARATEPTVEEPAEPPRAPSLDDEYGQDADIASDEEAAPQTAADGEDDPEDAADGTR